MWHSPIGPFLDFPAFAIDWMISSSRKRCICARNLNQSYRMTLFLTNFCWFPYHHINKKERCNLTHDAFTVSASDIKLVTTPYDCTSCDHGNDVDSTRRRRTTSVRNWKTRESKSFMPSLARRYRRYRGIKHCPPELLSVQAFPKFSYQCGVMMFSSLDEAETAVYESAYSHRSTYTVNARWASLVHSRSKISSNFALLADRLSLMIHFLREHQ